VHLLEERKAKNAQIVAIPVILKLNQNLRSYVLSELLDSVAAHEVHNSGHAYDRKDDESLIIQEQCLPVVFIFVPIF